jgi:hypothetical protein
MTGSDSTARKRHRGLEVDTVVAPVATPGGVDVRLTVGENSEGACVRARYTIVGSFQDPWKGVKHQGASAAPAYRDSMWVDVSFNPAHLCGFPAADTIHLIQTITQKGVDSSGRDRPLKYSEVRHWKRNAAQLDYRQTVGGTRVDSPLSSLTPYMTAALATGRSDTDALFSAGSWDPVSREARPARFVDGPIREDSHFPADIATIVLEYEVNAFGTHGPARGRWLGKWRWTWRRARGGTASVEYHHPLSYELPSREFQDALWKWRKAQPFFSLPQPAWFGHGGLPCN